MKKFDPYNPKHLERLNSAAEWSIGRLKDRREKRLQHLAQYVGYHYGENSASENVPINMIETGVNILQRFIASYAPKARISSPHAELLPNAFELELALNQEADRIDLSDAFNTWVIEALFCMGVLEVGITDSDTPPDGEGYEYDPGKLFVTPVLFDRLILDMSVGEWDNMGYVGHEYDVPLEWAKENPSFDKDVRKELTAPDRFRREDDANNLVGSSTMFEQLDETITLRRMFLPRQQLSITLASCKKEKKPLQVVEWEGPERGPYHRLSFGKVPGSVLPNAPVLHWVDLHDQVNTLWNKAANQAERQKTLLLIMGTAAADGSRIVNAGDGDAIYSDDPKAAVEMSTGGANRETLAMSLQAKQILDWIGGNFSALGGLAAQSKTVGQDQLLAQQAAGRPEDLQRITTEAQKKVFQDMAFWLYNDPISEYHLIKPIDGAPSTFPGVPVTWGPERRSADFLRYNITVDPFSSPNKSPSQRGTEYLQLIQQFLIPILPYIEPQGASIDWEYVLKTVAKLMDQPDFARSVRYTQGEAHPSRPPVEKPANTTRTYERVNRPGATFRGQEDVMIRQLMGGQSQGSEVASLFSPVG